MGSQFVRILDYATQVFIIIIFLSVILSHSLRENDGWLCKYHNKWRKWKTGAKWREWKKGSRQHAQGTSFKDVTLGNVCLLKEIKMNSCQNGMLTTNDFSLLFFITIMTFYNLSENLAADLNLNLKYTYNNHRYLIRVI